jgi:hypothetical protein
MKKVEIHFGSRSQVKILLLTLILFSSLSGSCQKDSTTINDSVVRISKSVAQKILIAADSVPVLKKEVVSLNKSIVDFKSLINVRDAQIKLKQDSIRLLSGIRVDQESQKQILIGTIGTRNRQLKWSKAKTTISQVLLLVVTGVLITKL